MAAVIAFGIVTVLTPFVAGALRRRGIVDVPNDRSSHSHPTPRGGGLAPALGMVLTLAVAQGMDSEVRIPLLLAIVAFGLLGLVEDLVGVPVVRRLLLQVLAVTLVSPWLLDDMGSPLLARLVLAGAAVTFVIGYVNAFNFMDGINGISVAQTIVAGAAWFIIGRSEDVGSIATAGAVIAAAALAFAPFNFPRAQVFLGDVGSYAFGAALAVLAVLGIRAGISPEAMIAPLAVYLADTGTTLIRRVLRGDPCFEPHRDHVYQRLVRMGWSHTATTATVAAFTLVVTALGTVSLGEPSAALRALVDVSILLVLGAYLSAPAAVRKLRSEPVLA